MGRRARVERDHDGAARLPAARVPRASATRRRPGAARTSCSRGSAPDGLWAIYWGGEPDLAATLESYAALRLAGLDADDPRLAAARRFCEERGGHRRRARLHAHLARALRALALGGDPADSAGARPPAAVDAALRLRLRLLGPPDGRPAHGRHALPARAQPAAGAARATSSTSAPRRARPRQALARATGRSPGTRRSAFKPGRERALALAERWIIDRQELDGSWGGIQPPWVWSLDRARLPRPRARVALPEPRARRLEALHGRGRRPAAARGVPVPGLGHRPRAARPPRRRRAGGRARPRARRRLARRRGDPGSAATGPSGARASSPAAGRSSTTTTSTRTSTTRPSSRSRSRSSATAGPPVERACRWMAGDAVVERRLGRLRRRQRRAVALQHPVLRLRRRDRPAVAST